MYQVTIPIGFLSLYVTQNIRSTRGSPAYSATVTAGRNQIGQFSEPYRFMVDILYKYVKTFENFGPRKLQLRYPDVFIHLTQNKTRDVEVSPLACYVSMPFVLQYHKNRADLHRFTARCMAAQHIMNRRYPKHWSAYYILLGIHEYYALMMQLNEGGRPRMNDFSGFGTETVMSFAKDDFQRFRPIMGAVSSNPAYYNHQNVERGTET